MNLIGSGSAVSSPVVANKTLYVVADDYTFREENIFYSNSNTNSHSIPNSYYIIPE